MTFLLAHLSDPHIGPLPTIPLAQLLNKRLTGVLNWRSARATIHDMDVLAAVLADIAAQAPDHVALTGDLVNVGYAPEFPQALRATQVLGRPEVVSIVPGNHDAYVRSSLPEMLKTFRPFMLGDDRDAVAFPYLRRRGPIALIGVSSGVPTLPFMATGTVGSTQRAKLGALLDATRREGLYRVVMIHHPPLKAGARFGRGLTDAHEFTRLLEAHGAELVIHGHNHRHSLSVVSSATGPVPILGVASASAVPGTPQHRAEYHLITIEPEHRRFQLLRRGLLPGSGKLGDLGGFGFPSTIS